MIEQVHLLQLQSQLPGSSVVVLSSILLLTLLSWRLWRFTVLPLLRPDEPRELPYWVPCHAVAFCTDTDAVIASGRSYFHKTREPYSLMLAGRRMYIIQSVTDISAALRNNHTLSFDDQIIEIMSRFGTTASGVEAMLKPPSPSLLASPILQPNRLHRPLAILCETFMKKQLNPGRHLDALQAPFLDVVHQSLNWEGMSPKAVLESTTTQRTVSLLEWTRQSLVEAATVAFFGPSLLKIDPSFPDHFFQFDDVVWKMLYRIPKPWSSDMLAAKDRMHCAIVAYLRLPCDQRTGCCWLVSTVETEMRARDIADEDIAANLMMVYWVFNSNPWKLCFWVLAHILERPDLLATIRAEVTPIVNGSSSPKELCDSLSRCECLLAAYHEVLRLVTNAISIRTVVADTMIGAKKLRAGAQVMLVYRQLLMDETVFGVDAESLNPARFLEDPALVKNSSFKPFGGGINHCPGRFIAKKEVTTFVALAVTRFDVALTDQAAAFPQMDTKKPYLGIFAPIVGSDVILNVRQRSGVQR